MSVSLMVIQPAFAQDASDTMDKSPRVTNYEFEDVYDIDDFDDIEELSRGLNIKPLTKDEGEIFGTLAAIFTGGFLILYMFVILGLYIYSALTLQKTADRIGEPNSWFAWIPILNMVLLYKMGDKNPWYLLLVFIPLFGTISLMVFGILSTMKICEKRGYDPMYGLFSLIPIGSLVLWGLLAWGKQEGDKVATA